MSKDDKKFSITRPWSVSNPDDVIEQIKQGGWENVFLRSLGVKADGLLKIVEALQSYDKVTSLDISDCKIRPSSNDVKAIAKKQNIELKQAETQALDQAQDIVTKIAKALMATRITAFNMSSNRLAPEVSKAFFDALIETKLQSLDFSYNYIGDLAGKKDDAFIEAVELMKEGANSIASMIKSAKALTHLKLNDVGINYETAEIIFVGLGGSSVTHVELDGAKVTPPEGKESILLTLKEAKSLTHLKMHSAFMSDAGAEAIAKILKDVNIIELDLAVNDIHDAGAEAIAKALKYTKLKRLVLNSNEVGDAGAKAFVEALKEEGTNLKELSLSSNKIGDAGAKAFEGAKGKIFVSLDLKWNHLGAGKDDKVNARADAIEEALKPIGESGALDVVEG